MFEVKTHDGNTVRVNADTAESSGHKVDFYRGGELVASFSSNPSFYEVEASGGN